jgi:hypothetical protein
VVTARCTTSRSTTGNGQHNADAAEMFREYDIRIEAGPDRHGITQGQFLYVFEPGGNRIELFGEPGFLHLEPDAETKTWLMSDIDTGLAIGGAKLPWETYFTYGTPNDLSVEEHAAKFSATPLPPRQKWKVPLTPCQRRSSTPGPWPLYSEPTCSYSERMFCKRAILSAGLSAARFGTTDVSALQLVSQATRASSPAKLGCLAKPSERVSTATVGSAGPGPDLDGRTAGDLLATLGGLILDPEVGTFHIKRFAARVPLTVLGDLGIATNAVRMALSRQVQRGLLSSTKVGREVVYSFTDAGERNIQRSRTASTVTAPLRLGRHCLDPRQLLRTREPT